MKTETREVYVAFDDSIHLNKEVCIRHEKQIVFAPLVNSLWAKYVHAQGIANTLGPMGKDKFIKMLCDDGDIIFDALAQFEEGI